MFECDRSLFDPIYFLLEWNVMMRCHIDTKAKGHTAQTKSCSRNSIDGRKKLVLAANAKLFSIHQGNFTSTLQDNIPRSNFLFQLIQFNLIVTGTKDKNSDQKA